MAYEKAKRLIIVTNDQLITNYTLKTIPNIAAVTTAIRENRNFIRFQRETESGEVTVNSDTIYLNVASILEIREESEETKCQNKTSS